MALDESFQEQLLAGFRTELQEYLLTITNGLLTLEQQKPAGDERRELLDQVFRAAHSLKGSARTVNARLISQLAHGLEDVLDQLRQHILEPTPELFTACYRTLDTIQTIQIKGDAAAQPNPEQALSVLAPFRKPAAEPAAAPAEPAPPPPPPEPLQPSRKEAKPPSAPTDDDETIRVKVNKLDGLMGQLNELVITKIRIEQRLGQLRALEEKVTLWQHEWLSLENTYHSLVRQREIGAGPLERELSRLFNYLDADRAQWQEVGLLIGRLAREYTNDTLQMSLTIGELEEEIKRVRMLPLSTILSPFGRMARDLAQEAGKEVLLQITGAETELDKRVLEQIKDPLIHLVRNAIDHGIEPPETRLALGKTRYGMITLTAEQQGQAVVIRVADDGQGLDLKALRQVVARQKGELAQTLTPVELEQTIYHVGISTSPRVTDISGRGVGLDIVRRNIEALHGHIDMQWIAGQGTAFLLTLPLTLSSTQGLLVRVGGFRFAVPLNAIERLLPLKGQPIAEIGGRETIDDQGRIIPLVRLADILELPTPPDQPPVASASIIVLNAGEQLLAVVVDELAGEQEIVNKALGPQLERVEGIAGATVLGDGEVMLVLNVADLIQMALHQPPHPPSGPSLAAHAAPKTEAPRSQRLLIVDDSITTRMLEKNILEAAGYTVELATNGQEAWEIITGGQLPDLVVSDVSMPRMDGVELTQHIRENSRTARVPVILVTSLDSPRDKARGIEAGADAYISKGSFDQNNLLGTIRQLI